MKNRCNISILRRSRGDGQISRTMILALFVLGGFVGATAVAQQVTTYGTLSNFDCVNDTDHECHGFEIELEDVFDTDVVYTFGAPYERYGDPIVIRTPIGCIIRYASAYDSANHAWLATTPKAIAPYPATMGHQCWSMGDPNYPNSGCEHFGISTTRNPTRTTYRWLVENPIDPQSLTPLGSSVSIPAPVWNVIPQPPPDPNLPPPPPIVVAVLPAPPLPPGNGSQWGEAIWEKVYVMESPAPVALDDLVLGGAGVPDPDLDAPEIEWQLLQSAPAGEAGPHEESENGGEVGEGAEAVSRRYEFYKYTGPYDPENHEAMCDDPLDAKCGPADPVTGLRGIGDFIGAQNAAVNLVPPVIGPTITCPDAVIVSATPEMCSAIVFYSDPAVTPPDGSFLCDPPSGSIFPAGTTTVVCVTANDNGEVECSFDTTVFESPAGCADADDCTMDACVEGTCGHFAIIGCCNSDPDCADRDDCTTDTCFDQACRHTPVPDCGPGTGDCDKDAHVDLQDFATLQNCFGEVGVAAGAACHCGDFDDDSDIDSVDWNAFGGAMSDP